MSSFFWAMVIKNRERGYRSLPCSFDTLRILGDTPDLGSFFLRLAATRVFFFGVFGMFFRVKRFLSRRRVVAGFIFVGEIDVFSMLESEWPKNVPFCDISMSSSSSFTSVASVTVDIIEHE